MLLALLVAGCSAPPAGTLPQGIERMSIPGPCEAIAGTSDGGVVAVFRGAGLFRLDTTWIRLADLPYSASDDAHFVHLAEKNGAVALVRTPFKSRGALWLLGGRQLVRVDLP